MPVIKTPQADLKAKYGIYLKVSFILSLVMIIAAFILAPKDLEKKKQKDDNPPERPEVIIPPTLQKKKLPLLPKQASKHDKIVENVFMKNTEINQNEVLDKPPGLTDRPQMEEEIPFTFVEILPEPIGGMNAIKEKIKYTEIGKIAGIEGSVIIEVTISKDGNPFDAVVLKGIGGGLDEAALNAVLQTKFKPGFQRDIPVSVRTIIKIKFELQ